MTQKIEKKASTENRLLRAARNLVHNWIKTSWELLKIAIPVIILTKIGTELGLIDGLSVILDPVMGLVGLPGSLGIVWATGLVTNIYAAMVVFFTLASGLELTVLQVTILCSMLLLAHSLPLEMAITRKAGGGFWVISILRVGGALIYGLILFHLCSLFNIWQHEVSLIFTFEAANKNLFEWCAGQIYLLVTIVVIILCILIIMKILEYLGILRWIERLLALPLRFLGMSEKAAPITVIGIVLGLSYGGSLIIQESISGRLGKKEVFYSLALMGLSHALIEDTLLMMTMGGKLAGIFWGRLLFSIFMIFLLVRIITWVTDGKKKRTKAP